MDATGVEATDTADHVHEAIQICFHAMEHVVSIAFKVCANLELARWD